jgi:CO/xanthine dehydrogenase Mo-binding subunit
MPKLIGKRIKRNEDPRLLTGEALFVDDVDIPGMLHAAFLRSDYAHAYLRSIDVSAARSRSGVVAVITAQDMGMIETRPPLVTHSSIGERRCFQLTPASTSCPG